MNEQQGVRPTERMTYRDSTYSIVSKVAYLIGVPKRIFENQHEPPQLEIFQQLENDKNARIIRHLCIIRTAIERNFKYINDKMRTEYKTILSLSQFVPADSISQLSADNVNFIRKWNTKLPAHIIEINRIISDRINNCKHLFPLWLNWKYIRELFIMPNGLCEKGLKKQRQSIMNTYCFIPIKCIFIGVPAIRATSCSMIKDLFLCSIVGIMTSLPSTTKSQTPAVI